MTEEREEYNHNQIIEWLENKYNNTNIYKELEECVEFQADVKKVREKQECFIYPRLSIDLIRVEKKLERGEEKKEHVNYYIVFFAISSKAIFKKAKETKYLKERLLFYQFYLSRITEPKKVEIIIVIPHYVNIPEAGLKFLKEKGFGLWKVKNGEGEKVECQPKSFGTRMEEEIATFRKDDGKKVEGSFFDQYMRWAVNAIAGVTPDKFGNRCIDRRLLSKILESKTLKTVSYGKKLQELVNEQLDENDNDYEFVNEVFNILWEENIGIPYSNFLKTFEPVLLHVFAEGEEKGEIIYRDHYIHQFQVFLLGIYIIDQLYDDFINCGYDKPEIKWLITSSFHDMAYPVQLYDRWSGKFFQDIFKVGIKVAELDLKSNFVETSFLSCMGYLICSLYLLHKNENVKGNWLADKKELVEFFYEQITVKKKHCILSSMSLLKIVQSFSFDEKNMVNKKISTNKDKSDDIDDIFNCILEGIFVPSALAIALHGEEVWQELQKKSDRDNPPKILDNIEFGKDPLSFLLIFCDNIQEWGRPSESQREKDEERRMRFDLKDIKYNPKTGLNITIRTPNNEKSEQAFIDKQDKLRSMQFFLKQPQDRKFAVRLEDKDSKGEDFIMQGSPS